MLNLQKFFVAWLLVAGLPYLASAEYIISSEFTVTSSVPAEYQNSTALSVTVNASDQVMGSDGFRLSTVPFDTSASTSTGFPFTSSHQVVSQIGFDQSQTLMALELNFSAGGRIWQFADGTWSEFAQFDSDQRSSRAMAFNPLGGVAATGEYASSTGTTGWVREYDAAGNVVSNFDISITPVGVGYTSGGDAVLASQDGRVFSMSDTGNLTLISQLTSEWVGPGVGYVESFTLTQDDGFLLGLNLGQKFGLNSGAIIRLNADNSSDVIAQGVGDIPVDMSFNSPDELFVASFNPYTQSQVFRFTGDFSGEISGASESPNNVPEPGSIVAILSLASVGIGAVVIRRRRAKSLAA